ncbi:HrpB1 family type III secretion system apparatus protein [Roseateles sp. SL47]|jgi:type III secretion protein HrpB1|uniref:HrpB1 family type III secretion system apparatus protein n=1 Tax=Roseateles sp. SL47 TaxID=2995138 RepID=UPI00227135D3|nr:HrpB1 family type III secretion system apparatus protein [Roseateles sp. SL47]WAC71592.1 HrpB1 family type III secretion system apparatus protein [Roseateles sp. SL47]
MNLMLQLKRREFVQGLVEIASVAMSQNLLDDADEIVACVRQLRPKLDQLDFLDAWIAILRGEWQQATRIARAAIERSGDWPFGTAILAYCQYATGDPTWSINAERVLAQPEAGDARDLMRMLLGRVDPEDIGGNEMILQAISSGQSAAMEHSAMRA